MTVAALYESMIRPLPLRDRLELMQRILSDAIAEPERRGTSLLALEGLGAEVWAGIDAQDYVNALRDEWEHRT